MNLSNYDQKVIEAAETLREVYGEATITLGRFEFKCKNKRWTIQDIENGAAIEGCSTDSLLELLEQNNITSLNYSWQ